MLKIAKNHQILTSQNWCPFGPRTVPSCFRAGLRFQPKNYLIHKFFIHFLEVFTIVIQKIKMLFLQVFPIVLIDQITSKIYVILKFFIEFLKVFTIVLQKIKIVFLMVFPIVILHQIHQKKVRF